MTETTETYLALYPDGHNEQIKLGELLNKGGAAGKIYRDASHPHSVAKIFHDRQKSDTNRKKLQSMLQNCPNIPSITDKGIEYIQLAWPTALLEDAQGFCVGYLMPLIDMNEALPLDYLIQKAVRQKMGLSERYVDRLFAAFNITTIVAALHACGHYIIDLKPTNVSVYKQNMLVSMFDCDGFSIKGENGERYPAEFVSEEYIYPEGMQQTCLEMGEEQDKFALAVIIFKLLNEGIHPYSGVPRKKENMLSLQERIAGNHYAYGMWPDNYQAPHPYSIHNYFHKDTLNLFERAFAQNTNRPTALEWQAHLDFLLNKKNHFRCKKDHNHLYFTPKGCGLCMVTEKFKLDLVNYKKQQEESQTVRGIDTKELTKENVRKQKIERQHINKIVRCSFYAFSVIYLILFASLGYLAAPLKNILLAWGIFAQFLITTILIIGLNKILALLQKRFSGILNPIVLSMLRIYAYICILIALLVINGFPQDWFTLTSL